METGTPEVELIYKVHMTSPRPWEMVKDIGKVNYVLKEYIKLQGLKIRHKTAEAEIHFVELRDDNVYVFRLSNYVDIDTNQFIAFRTLSRHVEVGFSIVEQRGDMILCRPVFARIAKNKRSAKRYEQMDNKINMHNFLVSKSNVDLTNATGYSGQILLTDLHKDLLVDFPGSKVKFIDGKPNSFQEDLIKEIKKPIYVQNATNMEPPDRPDCANLKEYFEEEFSLDEHLKEFNKRKIGSFVYYPIFFRSGDTSSLIAYCTLERPDQELKEEVLDKYKQLETLFNQRIDDANTYTMEVRQPIINISESGVLLQITEPNLIRSMLAKHSFTADITFKMQAPLRFAYRIKHITQVGETYFVGAEIVGSIEGQKSMEILKGNLKFISS